MDFRCRCGEWILAGGDEVLVRCPFCERSYRVVADAGGDLVLRPAETAPHETEECQTASRVQDEEQGRPPEVACETPDSAIDSSEVASKPLSEWSEEEFELQAPAGTTGQPRGAARAQGASVVSPSVRTEARARDHAHGARGVPQPSTRRSRTHQGLRIPGLSRMPGCLALMAGLYVAGAGLCALAAFAALLAGVSGEKEAVLAMPVLLAVGVFLGVFGTGVFLRWRWVLWVWRALLVVGLISNMIGCIATGSGPEAIGSGMGILLGLAWLTYLLSEEVKDWFGV